MSGKDLIIYILANDYTNESLSRIFSKCFLTEDEFASDMNIGSGTVRAWIETGRIRAVQIADTYVIPINEYIKLLKKGVPICH